jgi:hypothetical protein
VNSGAQDWNNISAGKALDGNNAASRLVISYVYDLPFGKGKTLFGNAPTVVDAVISGWGVNGVTTIQSGFPLQITYGGTNNLGTFGAGTVRPNVVAGCQETLPGSAVDRLNSGQWFNTSCFTAPATTFSFGDEPAYDPHIRGQGITNFDLAANRKFTIREHYVLQFRAEAFNIANHTRFANPGTSMGTATFGVVSPGISSQANQPRLIQLALRLTF